MVDFKHNIELKGYNSFGVNAKADRFVLWSGVDDLRKIFADPSLDTDKWMVMSGGCNILFTQDYDGTILHPTSPLIQPIDIGTDSVVVRVSAAFDWDNFVGWTISQGVFGAENLSFIPGMVGAAPVQNIGAYSVEVKDIIERVECYLPHQDKVVTMSGEECNFGYRDSIFKGELKGKAIVTSVDFRLQIAYTPRLDYGDLRRRVEQSGAITADATRRAVIDIRSEKLPDHTIIGNAGSFFKNPIVEQHVAAKIAETYPDMVSYSVDGGVKIPAGWMIDRAGWKGYRRGDAGVHENQALVLVNHGNATGSEILQLSQDIAADVKTKFGVVIEPEINIL